MALSDSKTPHDKLVIVRPGKQIGEPSTQRLFQSGNLLVAAGDHAKCAGVSSDFFIEVVNDCPERRFEKSLKRRQLLGISIGPADVGTQFLVQRKQRRPISFLLCLRHGWLSVGLKLAITDPGPVEVNWPLSSEP